MSKAEINALSKEDFEKAFRHDRFFTVKDAIEWLSKQNPDAGLMYFEVNSHAWCDMSPNMFRTVKEEKLREFDEQRRWHEGDPDADEKVESEMKEIFRYVQDEDICVRS